MRGVSNKHCLLTFFIISALHTAGKHMENSIVAAYVALLVGCLIQENKVSLDDIGLKIFVLKMVQLNKPAYLSLWKFNLL